MTVPASTLRAVPRVQMIVVLGLLSTFGPLSLDLYLPVLPRLADQLHASTSAAQLSITTCLLGLAVGQLVAGPLSDRYGRRRPLLVGLAAYLVASAVCALAPSIGVFLVLRLLQGLGGAAGLVIARAVARDLYGGRDLLVFFARLMLISGLAPIVAPVLGGQLSRVMGWRGMFGVLAGLGAVLLLAGVVGVHETLAPDRRTVGGLSATLDNFRSLLADRSFVGTVLAAGLAGASMFAYIAGSSFVLQRMYGLTPPQFSAVFATNALGIMAVGQLGTRLTRRWAPVRVLAVFLTLNGAGALALAATVALGLGFWFLVGSLFVMVSSLGMVFPTASTLAMSGHPSQAGAASSLLGLAQFIAGAVASPLVGVAGQHTAVPLAVVAATASVAASAVFWLFVRPTTVQPRLQVSEP